MTTTLTPQLKITGPDGDGLVWLYGRTVDGRRAMHNLGLAGSSFNKVLLQASAEVAAAHSTTTPQEAGALPAEIRSQLEKLFAGFNRWMEHEDAFDNVAARHEMNQAADALGVAITTAIAAARREGEEAMRDAVIAKADSIGSYEMMSFTDMVVSISLPSPPAGGSDGQ